MSNLSPNQVILLRRFGAGWYRAGQLTGGAYRHPIGVQNGLRGLMKAGLVGSHWGMGSSPTRYTLTNAGYVLAAQSRADQASNSQ